MTSERFDALISHYARLRVAVLGDFCLDRYLEIDPGRQEVSIETGLPVHNVVRVRGQPGGAGTILNNLSALGLGAIHALGFHGDDGEGYELKRALESCAGVRLDHFLATPLRRTFTYCKPLLMHPGRTPEELHRLDSKNWSATPAEVETPLIRSLEALGDGIDALILLDQVDVPDTGVCTARVLEAVNRLVKSKPELLVVADCRRGLRDYPPACYKMNRAELAAMSGVTLSALTSLDAVRSALGGVARRVGRMAFATLAEQGIVGATPDGQTRHVPAMPVRGPIDIVGAGDAVTANLTAALAAGSDLTESLELAMAAASIVIHQLGTTGAATIPQIRDCLSARFDP